MSNSEAIYYINGRYVPADDATLPVGDLAVVRGYGIFDFTRTYQGRPFHLMDHIARLRYSAAQIKLHIPHSDEEIAEIVFETVRRNNFAESNIRLVVTGGMSPNFFTPIDESSFVVMVTPNTPYAETIYAEGVKLISTRLQREFPTVKSLNYIGAIMALREAAAQGAREALYVDQNGYISECTRANFMTLLGNQLIVAKDNVLAGITQKAVLKLVAEQTDLEIVRRSLHYDELSQVDEAFYTSSTYEVAPVVQVDDMVIGSGSVGNVTTNILNLFRAYAQAGDYI